MKLRNTTIGIWLASLLTAATFLPIPAMKAEKPNGAMCGIAAELAAAPTSDFFLPEDYRFRPGEFIPPVLQLNLKPVSDSKLKTLGAPEEGICVKQWGEVVYYLNDSTWEVVEVVEPRMLAAQ